MSFKVAFIGAGSLVFARTLFTDINPDNLEKTRALCQRDLDTNNIPITIQATTDRREAFRNARYIVNCVRIGGLETFETDIEIPLKYGVDQCVEILSVLVESCMDKESSQQCWTSARIFVKWQNQGLSC